MTYELSSQFDIVPSFVEPQAESQPAISPNEQVAAASRFNIVIDTLFEQHVDAVYRFDNTDLLPGHDLALTVPARGTGGKWNIHVSDTTPYDGTQRDISLQHSAFGEDNGRYINYRLGIDGVVRRIGFKPDTHERTLELLEHGRSLALFETAGNAAHYFMATREEGADPVESALSMRPGQLVTLREIKRLARFVARSSSI